MSRSNAISAMLVALIGLIAVIIPQVAAQNPGNYPEWVTNDYDCVIGCMQVFNSSVTARPDQTAETSAYKCVTTTCNKETMAMNIYQTQYIISMFYATGSIYEDANMGSWTSVPNAYNAASTESGGETATPASGGSTETPAPSPSSSSKTGEAITTTDTNGKVQTSTRPIGAATASSSALAHSASASAGNGTATEVVSPSSGAGRSIEVGNGVLGYFVALAAGVAGALLVVAH